MKLAESLNPHDCGTMGGKKVIVTGASSGIGLETADALAREGAMLILIDCDIRGGEAAIARIARHGPKPELIVADLSEQREVRRVAGRIIESNARIDVLINNAGAWFNERRLTADGLERTFALNHMAYFILTHLLLQRIIASALARIISVSSDGHAEATLDFDDLQSERTYSGRRAYCRSKLANILFTRALARRIHDSGVTANCLHPGHVLTGFLDNVIPPSSTVPHREAMWKSYGYLPAADGARTPIYLACSPDVDGVNGQYFDDCRIVQPSPAAQDDAAAEQLWTESLRLTKLAGELSSDTPSAAGDG